MNTIIKEITGLRQQLHRQPELSYEEYKTTDLIQKTLEKWNLSFHAFDQLETGGYAEIGSGPTLLYRADIDALPIHENPNNPYASTVNNVMHACGHDFHTVFGLGLLRYFQLHPARLKGKLRVIFQPAEETTPTGAAKVIKEDIWKDARAILGIHVNSDDHVGKFSLSKTAANGSNTTVDITLKGPGGHTSRPDQSVDMILSGAEYITQLHSYLKNKIDPRDTVAFAFGKVCGGYAKNAIPQSLVLSGTLRTHANRVLDRSITLIQKFSKTFSKLHNLKIDVNFPTSCPVAENDPKMVTQFIQYYKNHADDDLIILPKPSMGADDFAYYLKKVPGLYLRVGGAGKGAAHTEDFVVNEAVIAPAVRHLAGYITYFFKEITE